jgi:hypothetical protein
MVQIPTQKTKKKTNNLLNIKEEPGRIYIYICGRIHTHGE